MDKKHDGDYLRYVSGEITISGVITISSEGISGFSKGRDKTLRYLAYSSGCNVISESEGNRGKVGKVDMETEEGRRDFALQFEELVYSGVKKMVQTTGKCDTGIVMFHPFGNKGEIDVLWISASFGNVGIEAKRLIKSRSEKCCSFWMDERFCYRYNDVENIHGIPINYRVAVITKEAWFSDLNEYLSRNKVYRIVTGQIDTPEQKKLAEAEFENGLLRVLVFQEDLLNYGGDH